MIGGRRRVLLLYQQLVKRVLQSLKRMEESGLTGEQAIMAAFEENAHDAARIGGG